MNIVLDKKYTLNLHNINSIIDEALTTFFSYDALCMLYNQIISVEYVYHVSGWMLLLY